MIVKDKRAELLERWGKLGVICVRGVNPYSHPLDKLEEVIDWLEKKKAKDEANK